MTDLDDQLDFTVDPDAEPTDLDAALARFLLGLVRASDEAQEASLVDVSCSSSHGGGSRKQRSF